MNNYKLISLIDGILDRLFAVAPLWDNRLQGPKQWLYVCEPKIPFEIELARAATTLSVPTFPPSERWDRDSRMFEMEDGTFSSVLPPPRLYESLRPLPTPSPGQDTFSVDFHAIQSLSGLRAVLLVLLDASSVCCSDPDFIGHQPWEDSLSVLQIMKDWSESDFVPNSKYWKDWPLARFLQNPFPPVPRSWTLAPTATLFSGETGRFYRRLATYDTTRPDSFQFYRAVFGIAQSKRGFARVPVSFVLKAMEKHAAQLSSPPPPGKEPLDVAKVTRFARTFFRGLRLPSMLASLSTVEASTRASVENPRLKGGAREFIRHLIGKSLGYSDADAFVGMREVSPGFVVEDRGLPQPTTSQWVEILTQHSPDISREYLPLRTQTQLDELFETRPDARVLPTARVAEVLEPLKVRLITAMDALRSKLAKVLQETLWSFLRSSPVFVLIGEEISESLIHDLVKRHLEDGGFLSDDFLSGDYSAATDGLNILFSKTVLSVILDHLHPDDVPFRDQIASVLLEQVIVYPGWTQIKPIVQANGQLMGSVLSFPILCLANLFAYIDARTDSSKVFRSRKLMDRLPVRINGDDILFRTSNAFYERWRESIDRVGFTLSVGKNFRHKRFFTVNSVPIEWIPALSPGQFWSGVSWPDLEESSIPFHVTQVPTITIGGFLNVGLLTGQAKLTGRESLGSIPLSGWYSGSVLDALNPPLAHKWFLHYHKREILRQTRFGRVTLNIFAHPYLGGLGFPIPPGVSPGFSEEQRRLATALFLSAQGTFEGQESEYKLDSLVLLESESMGSSLVGIKPKRVNVELFPSWTPLPEGYEYFVDSSGVSPLPLVQRMGDASEVEPSTVRCRLSNRRLFQLTRRLNNDLPLHPTDEMTVFPFLPVRVHRTVVVGGGSVPLTTRPTQRVYSPSIPFQDVPVPASSSESPPSRPMVLEDWEIEEVRLVVPVQPPPPVTSVARLEARARIQAAREFHANFVAVSPPINREFDYRYSRKGGNRW